MEGVILEELNVKALEFVTEESGVVRRKAKPNFKTLGPKFGKSVQAVAANIRDWSNDELNRLLRDGTVTIRVDGSDFTVDTRDVEVLHEDIKGWLVESDGSVTVALDTELTEELVREGLAREFVNRVQNMRKDSGFEVTDRITIYHRSSGKLAQSVSELSSYIQQETLAAETCLVKHGESSPVELTAADINGEQTEVGLVKATRSR
jgi:isoleucyl-tRNA synthetase